MNRKEQQFLRQRQTTRQLMGVTRLTEHGAVCGRDELLFYLLRPDNLSILSPKGIRGRVRALTGLLQGMASLELLALDSRESFLKNKQYYQRRLEEEPSPALRELLRSSSWSAGWTARPQRIGSCPGDWRSRSRITAFTFAWPGNRT